MWGIKLSDSAFIQHQNTIIIHDCLETMSNGDDDGTRKFFANRLLDLLVYLHKRALNWINQPYLVIQIRIDL